MPTGLVQSPPPDMPLVVSDAMVRPAILVHSGPNGSELCFESSDGEICFGKARIQDIVTRHNAEIARVAADYGGIEFMPMGAHIPLLDQHSDISNDCIRGRLNYPLRFEIRDVPKVGKNVACVVTDITFLGHETKERVCDGRIFHLSVGINDDKESPTYNTLGECSTVIEPAAPGAMLLKKGRKAEGDKVSKKLAAIKKRQKALAEIKSTLTTLGTASKASSENVKLAKAKGLVTHRLNKLIVEKKMTPAEFKKMDLVKLAKLDSSSLDTIMDTFNARENVIEPGQRGSASMAIEFSTLNKDLESKQQKKLKSEVKDSMKRLKKDLKFKGDEDKEMGADKEGKDEKKMKFGDKVKGKEMSSKEDDGDKEMAGDDEGDKEVKDLAGGKDIPDAPGADEMTALDQLMARVDEQTTQIARLAGLVDEIMSAEKDSESDLEEGDEGDEKDLADGDGMDEKELSGAADEKEKDLAQDEDKEDSAELSGDDKGEKDLAGKDDEKEKDLSGGDEKEKDLADKEKKAKKLKKNKVDKA